MTRTRKTAGRVVFVGAGPGDPGLLTRRAYDALVTADHVVYDRHVSEPLLTAIKAEADHEAQFSPAEGAPGDVAKVLLSAARSGLTAVHLVGGDPLGHDSVVKEVHALDFESIASALGRGSSAALAVDAGDLATVRDGLLAAGVDPATPVAVTGEGTGDTQYTTSSTVDSMVTAVIGFAGRVVVSLGAGVAQRDKLGWWENRPLYGWKVLVPRTKEQAGAMSERLREYGAIPCEVPTIA